MSIWNRIVEWFSDRSERDRLVRNFNNSAKEAFINGIAPTMLKAKISRGCKEYHHKYSSWLSSGFRIEVFSGRQLSKDEIKLIGQVILSDDVLVRRLVVLGWDTLEIHCDEGNYGLRWQLKDFMYLEFKN